MNLATLPDFVGRELGVSDWETLDQKRIDQFAECTGDHQWIHVEVARAQRESALGSTIAHGYLTLSLIAKTSFDLVVRPLGASQALNYGLDKVRFIAPVKAGARVRNRIVLAGLEPKGDGRLLIHTENTLEIEGEPKPALIAGAIVLAFTA